MMDSCGYMNNPLQSRVLLTLLCEYEFKALAVGAYSHYIVCVIIVV